MKGNNNMKCFSYKTECKRWITKSHEIKSINFFDSLGHNIVLITEIDERTQQISLTPEQASELLKKLTESIESVDRHLRRIGMKSLVNE